MTIDWTKKVSAADKAAKAAEEAFWQDELERRAALHAKVKDDPTFDEIKEMTPEEFDAFVEEKISTIPPAQRPVISFLLKVAIDVVRKYD